ncbi:MAG: hypothetical protein ACOC41_05095 [Chitinivibrionales bacterium]
MNMIHVSLTGQEKARTYDRKVKPRRLIGDVYFYLNRVAPVGRNGTGVLKRIFLLLMHPSAQPQTHRLDIFPPAKGRLFKTGFIACPSTILMGCR